MKIVKKDLGLKRIDVLESKLNVEKGLFLRKGISTNLTTKEQTSFEYIMDLNTGKKYSLSDFSVDIECLEWTPVYSKIHDIVSGVDEEIKAVRLYREPSEEEAKTYQRMINLCQVTPLVFRCYHQKNGQITVCQEDSNEVKVVKNILAKIRRFTEQRQDQSIN